MGAQAGAAPLALLDPAQTDQLGRLAKQYTMQKERDVHESVMRGSAIAAAPPIAVSKVALEDGGLGDNVELF